LAGWTFVRIFEKKTLLDPFGWDGGFGYINQAGSFVIGPSFRKDQPFRDGIAEVCDSTRCGYIDSHGNRIWPKEGTAPPQ
jgi:hypothetical protein